MPTQMAFEKCFSCSAKPLGREIWRIVFATPFLLLIGAQAQTGQPVTLPDHVLGILPKARLLPRTAQMDQEPLTLCVMLNSQDQAGLDAADKDFHDPKSANYHKAIKASDLTERFGPTQQAYDTVMSLLQQDGFTIAVGSANRLTISVHGTRAQAEAAFNVQINDYVLGSTTFHANATDPSIPQSVAPYIRSIVGLSNLYRPTPAGVPVPNSPMSHSSAYDGTLTPAGQTNTGGLPPGLDGTGQFIGLIEYDNYDDSDVKAWLSLVGLPESTMNRLSRSPIDGGRTASNGGGTTEVLLDIDAALGIAQGASVVVFVTPYGTDTLTTINAAINQMNALTGGVGGILSSSWGSACELAVTKSEAKSTDSALETAALTGITLFVDSADGEATCAGGVPSGDSTIGVHYPSDAPHAVAVGGTTLSYGPDSTYGGETWWNQSATTGGSFGVSTYFNRPSYQDSHTSASGRSVPDISADAGSGIIMCQASVSKTCFGEGGTSLATPTWASIWAIVSQALVDAGMPSVSASGNYFYNLTSSVFHTPASMTGPGNDFAHVGLGSPDITKLASFAVNDELQVEKISPSSGKGSGGTTVTITGKGFIGVQKVTFGGVDATNVTIYSDTKLTAVSPVAPADQVDIQVFTYDGGTPTTGSDLFSYLPEITSISPNPGALSGGWVTVNGRALSNASFTFGGSPAALVSCLISTQCTMAAPAHSAGVVDVIAAAKAGSSPAAQYTYVVPSIIGVTPSVGPTTGGQAVELSGAGLDPSMTVKFGSTTATVIDCMSPSSCSVYSPAGTGSVHVTATLSGSTSITTPWNLYTYQLFPSVTGISLSSGPVTGAVAVTVTGTNFSTAPGGTTFNFGTLVATGVTCSSTQCNMTAPVRDSTAGFLQVQVTATVNGYTSIDSVVFRFGTPPPVAPPPPCKGTACQ
jgi:Pro-kumamolisin, activation domain/IPT/TIG domain